MKTTLAVLFFCMIIFTGCGGDKDESTSIDLDAPRINLSNIPIVIEKKTDISVKIEDESNEVNTKILLNDKVIFESKEKEFLFSFDPFDYEIGIKEMKIVSENAKGKRTTETKNFELRKLLILLNFIPSNIDFVAIHKLNGVLLDYKERDRATISFYADDDFSRQNFTITSYQLNDFNTTTYIRSYSDIEAGTEGLTLEERRTEFNGLRLGNTNKKTLQLSSLGKNLIGGHSGIIQATNGNLVYKPLPNGEYDFLYNIDIEEDFYLFSVYENETVFKNKFVKINDLSKTSYEEDDFVPIANYEEISLVNISRSFWYTVEGYKSRSDYENYKFHLVNYDYALTDSNYKIRVPLIEDFELYKVKFIVTLGDNSFVNVSQLTNTGDIVIPSMNITRTNNSLMFSGEREYDYSYLSYRDVTENEPGDFSNFSWTFHQKFKQEINLPFRDFEHPLEILNLMNTTSLSPLEDSGNGKELYCLLNYFEDELLFENLIFSPGYFGNELGNKYTFEFGNLLE